MVVSDKLRTNVLANRLLARLARDYTVAAKTLILALLTLMTTAAYQQGWLDRLEKITIDHRFQLRAPQTIAPNIVLVEIAEDSIEAVGRWPWDRKWHAALIRALDSFGAKAVAFDILFSEEQDIESDALLASTIQKSGHVYLPISVHTVRDREQGERTEIIRSIPRLREAARGEGHIGVSPDADGILRHIYPRIAFDGEDYWQLGVRLGIDHLGAVPNPPAGSEGMLINWPGKWKDTFKHVSFVDVVVSYERMLRGEPPRIPIDVFKDAICIVGISATALFDIKATPIEPAYPAMGVNAVVLNSVINNAYIKPAPAGMQIALFWLLGLAILVIMLRAHYSQVMVLILLLASAYIVTGYALFFYAGIVVSIAYPLLLCLAGYIAVTSYHQIVISMEKKRLLSLASTDSLTGLYNIGHFRRLLTAEMVSTQLSSNKSIGLVMVDADHFKRINDEYGHAAGDDVLKFIAQAIRANCRALDVAARYGGEEFVLMLPGASLEATTRIAVKMRQAIEDKKFNLGKDDRTQTVTASFGVTQYRPGEPMDDFLKRADKALYSAKNTGRNRVVTLFD